jgi:ribosomal protein L16/L10AE
LVVDPHSTLRTVLAQRLRQDGHLAAAVATAREALELAAAKLPMATKFVARIGE